MLRYLALIYLVISIIGILLQGKTNEKSMEKSTSTEPLKPHLKSPVFIKLFLCAVFSVSGGIYIAGTYKNFGDAMIGNDRFLAIVGSVSSVFNGSFRYLWGFAMDKTSFRFSYLCLIGL